jgi:hypothetical protein
VNGWQKGQGLKVGASGSDLIAAVPNDNAASELVEDPLLDQVSHGLALAANSHYPPFPWKNTRAHAQKVTT